MIACLRRARKTLIISSILCFWTGIVQADPAISLSAPNSTSGEPSVNLNRTQGKVDIAFSISAAGPILVKALNKEQQQIVVLLEERLESGTHEYSFFLKEFSSQTGPITFSFQTDGPEIRKVTKP